MELIFNPCGEFRWSPEGPVGQIHSPHLHVEAPDIFSDLLRPVQMLKREWGAESYGKLLHLVNLQPWFLSLWWKTCLRQNYSLGSCACSEGPVLGQNTHDDDADDDDDILNSCTTFGWVVGSDAIKPLYSKDAGRPLLLQHHRERWNEMKRNKWDECEEMGGMKFVIGQNGGNPEKNLPRSYFVHHENHMEWPRRDLGAPAVGDECLNCSKLISYCEVRCNILANKLNCTRYKQKHILQCKSSESFKHMRASIYWKINKPHWKSGYGVQDGKPAISGFCWCHDAWFDFK